MMFSFCIHIISCILLIFVEISFSLFVIVWYVCFNFSFLKEEFRECSWLQQMSDRRYEKANATSVKSCKGECVALDKVLNKKEIFFLLCSGVWKWLWPSLAVSKRWLLRVYPQGSDLQSFLDKYWCNSMLMLMSISKITLNIIILGKLIEF